MRNVIFVILILVAALSASWLLLSQVAQEGEDPGDLHVYLDDTDEMVRHGEYEAALERYIWFHEHALVHDPHMAGVRLSFALCGWRRLADMYPPAMEALVTTRERAASEVKSGAGGWDTFHDVQSLNKALEDERLTVELFQHLNENDPELAERVWDVARHDVIAAGQYELAGEYIGNPIDALASYRRSFERDLGRFDDDEEIEEFFRQHSEDRFVERTLELMEVFGGLGREDLVEQIGTEALETFSDPRIERAMLK